METKLQENLDLLETRSKNVVDGNLSHEELKGPPDGGLRAYTVMLASFLTNGLVFGIINSYSVIYNILEEHLRAEGIPNSQSRAALVGALAMGTTFLMSPVGGVLTGVLGFRLTTVLGGVIATAGMILSSFFAYNADVLNFTYGIMYGFGASLAYNPSLAILGQYFQKHLGKVNGVVTVGSSIFTVIIPPLMDYVILNHGLEGLFRLLAVFSFGLAVCGLSFKPLITTKTLRKDEGCKSFSKSIIDFQIWKNKQYRLWAISMPVALFGYFVPYVHIKKYIEINFGNVNTNLPLQCIAVTSGVGRLIFGFLADRPGMDRILLQQISFYVIGVLTIILPFVKLFGFIVAVALGMGIFDGAFVALIGPIAFELVGREYAAQAIGCMLGIASIPLSIGPPTAGYIYMLSQSYTLPFALAGISPLVGATLMFAIRYQRVRANRETANTNGVATHI